MLKQLGWSETTEGGFSWRSSSTGESGRTLRLQRAPHSFGASPRRHLTPAAHLVAEGRRVTGPCDMSVRRTRTPTVSSRLRCREDVAGARDLAASQPREVVPLRTRETRVGQPCRFVCRYFPKRDDLSPHRQRIQTWPGTEWNDHVLPSTGTPAGRAHSLRSAFDSVGGRRP
jgi:hypothetical protein